MIYALSAPVTNSPRRAQRLAELFGHVRLHWRGGGASQRHQATERILSTEVWSQRTSGSQVVVEDREQQTRPVVLDDGRGSHNVDMCANGGCDPSESVIHRLE